MADRSAPRFDERDLALVLDMILAAEDGLSFMAGLDEATFRSSRLHQNAVIRSLEVIGEAAGKLSTQFRSSHDEIPWREIVGMRHRLIHDYGGVSLDVVWRITRERLPDLLARLRPLWRRLTRAPSTREEELGLFIIQDSRDRRSGRCARVERSRVSTRFCLEGYSGSRLG